MASVIRSGRCDNCRRIKRKCNEVRPACSGCQSRKIDCIYSTEVSKFIYHLDHDLNTSEFSKATLDQPTKASESTVVLKVRSTKETPAGDGLYRTFVFRPPPMNQSEKLSNEFHGVLYSSSHAGGRLKLWGQWLVNIGPRLGHNPLLDRAAACLIKGHSARNNRNRMDVLGASRRQYSNALILLKNELAAGKITIDIIAVTRLLMALELMTGDDHINWLCHAYGAVHLFQAAGPAIIKDGDFAITLFEVTYVQAWQQAFVTGKPSVFDTPEWLAIADDLAQRLDRAVRPQSEHKFHIFTRLPRLVSLVKALRSDLLNRKLAVQACGLACELLDLVWDLPATSGPQHGPIVPTETVDDSAIVPFSFQYDEEDFELAMSFAMHWACKIMISGLCISLHECDAPDGMPSLEDLRTEEQRCATLICMSVESAKRLLPYGASAIMLPMQVAWGVYWRKHQARDGSVTDSEIYATMTWLRDTGNSLLSHVSSQPMTDSGLTMFTNRLMGNI